MERTCKERGGQPGSDHERIPIVSLPGTQKHLEAREGSCVSKGCEAVHRFLRRYTSNASAIARPTAMDSSGNPGIGGVGGPAVSVTVVGTVEVATLLAV